MYLVFTWFSHPKKQNDKQPNPGFDSATSSFLRFHGLFHPSFCFLRERRPLATTGEDHAREFYRHMYVFTGILPVGKEMRECM
jgi:hypothetical protein